MQRNGIVDEGKFNQEALMTRETATDPICNAFNALLLHALLHLLTHALHHVMCFFKSTLTFPISQKEYLPFLFHVPKETFCDSFPTVSLAYNKRNVLLT